MKLTRDAPKTGMRLAVPVMRVPKIPKVFLKTVPNLPNTPLIKFLTGELIVSKILLMIGPTPGIKLKTKDTTLLNSPAILAGIPRRLIPLKAKFRAPLMIVENALPISLVAVIRIVGINVRMPLMSLAND